MRVSYAALLVLLLAGSSVSSAQTVGLPEVHEFTNPDRAPFALSPDGTTVAYLARATLYTKKLSGGEPVLVTGPLQGRGKTNPVFSPDGRSILYWAQDDSVLQRVPTGGGAPVTVAAVDNPMGLSWGADGQVLIGGGAKGILRVPASGGPVDTLIKMNPGEVARNPQMLPGGDAVLFTLGQGTPVNWGEARVVVQSLRTGQRTVLATGRDGRYLSSGYVVYATGTSLVAIRFNAATLSATGQPSVLAPRVQSFESTGAVLYAASASGAIAYVGGDQAPIRLERVGLDGSRRVLGTVPEGTTAPRASADGRKVTFAAAGMIYVADIDNVNGAKKVIENGTFPLFSPDGQWLVFGSLGTKRNNGEERVFMQKADGSGEAELIIKPGRAPEHWRAGDQGFTFITHRGGANNYDLWVYSPEKKEVEPLVVVNESAQLSSALSPDRKWVAYMSTETGDWQIFVQPYPTTTGAKFQVTTQGGRSPMWTSDGRLVYDNDGKLFAVTVQLAQTPTFGSPRELPVGGHIQPLLRRNWDMMPDGASMLMLFRQGPQLSLITNVAAPTAAQR